MFMATGDEFTKMNKEMKAQYHRQIKGPEVHFCKIIILR